MFLAKKTLLRIALSMVFGLPVFHGYAEPWVNAGDSRTRHHLQIINDASNAAPLITAWPLMWSDVKAALEAIDPRTLTPQVLWSYRYLQHELRLAERPSHISKTLHLSNAPLDIGHFGSKEREKAQGAASVSWLTDNFAAKLKGGYVHNPTDERDHRADGSYAAYLFGNWALGAGAIDRWWGPGWESSLILSNNARPIPGVFIQRQHAKAFESKWLSWLGPWQLTSFMGELEQDRAVPDARLWGMRVTLKPLNALEIGLSRTAQWGGDGRPGDLDNFFNLLVGKDNRGDDVTVEEEPGNQLAGVDFRINHLLKDLTVATYGQLIGEDEAGGLPSRHIGMGGIESAFMFLGNQVRLSFEGVNTTVYFHENKTVENPGPHEISKPSYNTAYEHAIYRSGYRYLGRPIGAAMDNDSESYTLRAQLYQSNGHHAELSVASLRINRDSKNKEAPGGNVFGNNKISDTAIRVEYNIPLTHHYELSLGAFKHSSALRVYGDEIDSGAFATLSGKW